MTDSTLRLVTTVQVASLTIKSYYQGETSHPIWFIEKRAFRPHKNQRNSRLRKSIPSDKSTELRRKSRRRETIQPPTARAESRALLARSAITPNSGATLPTREKRLHSIAGGGSGIRTHDTVSRIHAFQACAFSHSATPPAHGNAGNIAMAFGQTTGRLGQPNPRRISVRPPG
jgi:hypothetical protein